MKRLGIKTAVAKAVNQNKSLKKLKRDYSKLIREFKKTNKKYNTLIRKYRRLK